MAQWSWQLQPPEGGNPFTGTFDTESGDPAEYHGPVGRAAINAGLEGDFPAFRQSRYFGERAQWDAFKASGLSSVGEYFSQTPDPWWDGLAQEDKEREIYADAGVRSAEDLVALYQEP